MRFRPDDPLGPVPERITHTDRDPCESASVRKNTSTGARRCSRPVNSETASMPSLISRLLFGEIT
jgi:hypothetical protein